MPLQTLLFWPVFCCLLAVMQGLLLPAVKLTPKGSPEAKRQDIALHWIGGAVYILPVLFTPLWLAVFYAISCRLLLFDPLCNAAAGSAMFSVGKTAKTDRLLQFIAAKTGVPVSWLSAFLRLSGLVVVAFLIFRV